MRYSLALTLVILLGSSGVPATPPVQITAEGVPQDPSALGYLRLHQRHPGASSGPVEFNTEYTAAIALHRLQQIEAFLQSFRRLTERAKRVVSPAELREIGYTDAEMQTIGFHNIPLAIEGTLRKQDYQLTQARYELAQTKHARAEISDRDLDRARRDYAEATKRFQRFWDSKLPVD